MNRENIAQSPLEFGIVFNKTFYTFSKFLYPTLGKVKFYISKNVQCVDSFSLSFLNEFHVKTSLDFIKRSRYWFEFT